VLAGLLSRSAASHHRGGGGGGGGVSETSRARSAHFYAAVGVDTLSAFILLFRVLNAAVARR